MATVSYVRQVVVDALPSDWPDWAVEQVIDEAREFAAEVHRPWVVHDLSLAKSVEAIYQELERAAKRGPEEAEASWWERFESGALEAEIERALDGCW